MLRLPQLLLVEEYEAEVAPGLDAVQQRLSLSDEQLKGVVLKLPQLLGLDYATEVAPKLDALQQRLGCDDAALAAEVRANSPRCPPPQPNLFPNLTPKPSPSLSPSSKPSINRNA